jgi:hypothetical protein
MLSQGGIGRVETGRPVRHRGEGGGTLAGSRRLKVETRKHADRNRNTDKEGRET